MERLQTLQNLIERIIFIQIFQKGYQISQYKYPIVSGGVLAGFDITRVHLEEDTANNKHKEGAFQKTVFWKFPQRPSFGKKDIH